MLPAGLSEVERAVCEALPAGSPVQGEGAVRAEVVAALLARPPAGAAALMLTGVRITGLLNVPFAQAPFPILLEDCDFDDVPNLYWARLGFFSLRGSRLPGLNAANLQVDGHLQLSRCRFSGPVKLRGAKVSGAVLLRGTRIRPAAGPALLGDRMEVGGDLVGNGEFTARGEVSLRDATIGGRLDLNGSRLSEPGGHALVASGLTCGGGVFAQGARIQGEVRLRRVQLGGSLTLSAAVLDNPGGVALRADRVSVENGVFLQRGFESYGEVVLAAARIGRNLVMDGARLCNPGGLAFRGDHLTLDGVLRCRDGFTATGEVSLVDAQVNGSVHFEGARLDNPGGDVLTANGISVNGVMKLCEGFHATGQIRLNGARIARRLCFDKATLAAGSASECVLRCWRMEAGELTLRTAGPAGGAVDLRHSRLGLLRDSPSTWPEVVRTDGVQYEALEPRDRVAERIGWLRRDPAGYLPQPYEQLAAMYRRLGEEGHSRTVLLAGQRHRRGTLPWYARAWGHLQDATVGYGYRPIRAASWLLALLLIGTLTFALQHPRPTAGNDGIAFNPFLYAVDVLVPLLDFGQQQAFTPATAAVQWLTDLLTVVGWILTTTIAAGITRSLRR